MGEKKNCTPFWRLKGTGLEMDIGYCDVEGNRVRCESDVKHWFGLAESQS